MLSSMVCLCKAPRTLHMQQQPDKANPEEVLQPGTRCRNGAGALRPEPCARAGPARCAAGSVAPAAPARAPGARRGRADRRPAGCHALDQGKLTAGKCKPGCYNLNADRREPQCPLPAAAQRRDDPGIASRVPASPKPSAGMAHATNRSMAHGLRARGRGRARACRPSARMVTVPALPAPRLVRPARRTYSDGSRGKSKSTTWSTCALQVRGQG